MKNKTKVSLTFERPLAGLITDARDEGLLTAIEFVPDAHFLDHSEGSGSTILNRLKEIIYDLDLPYSFHMVTNSLLSADFEVNSNPQNYFDAISHFSPIIMSEHLTCSRIGELDLTGNLTTVYREDSLQCAIENLIKFKEITARDCPYLLEHIPQFFKSKDSTVNWDDFYINLVKDADYYFLLDLHNLYCDEVNNKFNIEQFLERLPADSVKEIHLAGGETRIGKNGQGVRYDAHNNNIPERVFELLEIAKKRFNPILINLERESNFTDLGLIWKDLERVNKIWF